MSTDHVKMLCDIGELNRLFEESSIDDFLARTVDMVATHMNAGVCSIYLYDEGGDELVLKATRGLSPDSVNRIRLKPGEGLVGTSLLERTTVREKVGSENPRYRFYPGSNEELFEAFLAIPIVRGATPIGVLAVQRERGDDFDTQDELALRATASQLASMLEHIRLLMSMREGLPPRRKDIDFTKLIFLKGKSASSGTAMAGAVVFHRTGALDHPEGVALEPVTGEDFERALLETERELEELQQKVEAKLSDAASLIFASHLLMIKDSGFTGGMKAQIAGGVEPRRAVRSVFEHYRDIFRKSENPLIREKVQDIEDLAGRIIAHLNGGPGASCSCRGRVVIAHDLFPSDLLKLAAEGAAGIVLVSGGVTSHVGILARSLEIPTLFIDEPALMDLPDGTPVLLDADVGNLYVRPGQEVLSRFEARDRAGEALVFDPTMLRRPAATSDGTRINLAININLLSDVSRVGQAQYDGVGLYRTEFPFMIRSTFPSEEEQFVIYRRLINDVKGLPVTFRTLDIGGDKVLSYYQGAREENPFLGMRSIRFSLRHPDIFRQQIRAILRAGYGSPLRLMFPMISSLDELRESREMVGRCMDELAAEGVEFNREPLIGIMVEIPSVIPIIRELAAESGFFSVGTNDLIQYTLAVDRTNEKVADMYVPHHPAILRSLKAIADAAIDAGIEASVCGDMAIEPRYIPFLLGVGMRSLSIDPQYMPAIKKAIAAVTIDDARALAEAMLGAPSLRDVEGILERAGPVV